jgi:uncharacterized membrane protein
VNTDLSEVRFKEVYETEQGCIMSDFDENIAEFFGEDNHFDGYSIITMEELADQNYAEYERLKDFLDSED